MLLPVIGRPLGPVQLHKYIQLYINIHKNIKRHEGKNPKWNLFFQTPYGMSRYNPATNRPPNVRIPGQVKY